MANEKNLEMRNLSSRKLWMIVDKREQSTSSAMMNAAHQELARRRHSQRFHPPH